MFHFQKDGFPIARLDRRAVMTATAVGLVTLALGLAMAIGLRMPGAGDSDVFFVGPAVRFATTGEMKTFLLEWKALPSITEEPFWYVPIYFYALGYWFAVFGISTVSALCFYATLAAASSTGISLMLWRFDCPPRWCFASSLLCWTSFYASARFGFRPESLALAFLLAGLPLLPSSRAIGQSAGFLLVALAMITAPRMTGWCVSWAGLFAAMPILDGNRAIWRNAALGGAVAFALFAFSIHFAFATFYSLFSAHADIRVPSVFEHILHRPKWSFGNVFYGGDFARYNREGIAFVAGLAAIASIPLAYWRTATPLLVTSVIGYFLSVVTGDSRTIIFIYVAALGLWGITHRVRSAAVYRRLALAACIVLCGVPFLVTSLCYFKAVYRSPEIWADYQKIRDALSAEQCREMWIDSLALRYIFDMNPPTTARASLNQSLRDEMRTISDPHFCYLYSASNLRDLVPGMVPAFQGRKIFERTFYVEAAPPIYLVTHKGVLVPTLVKSKP